MSPSERYERARKAYLRALYQPTWSERVGAWLAWLWAKAWGGILLAIATSFFALGISAVEVPDWCLRGICAVESGCDWRSTGDVRGKWDRGAIGEVSCFQLSPAVLRDLHAYDRRFRVHADVVFAESLTRAWLLRLYGVTGSWPEACAAYHAGLGRRSESFAVTYAARVLAAGSTN